ncbi:hypothetical protein HZA57_00415, partial [Candidatus Poribacteria bacterium]|nr:hypothetical protein [Candidatus Poribacteria bacterium]
MDQPENHASPPMGHVADLEKALHIAQAGFRDYNAAAFPSRPPEFFALELAGEAGEIANKEKKLWKGRDIPLEEMDGL